MKSPSNFIACQIALFALLTAIPASAKVASLSFDKLAQSSDVIVVAKVESVTKPVNGRQYAWAKVTEVWKGAPGEKVEFLASPTWACDVSEAKKGETVLLFLVKDDKAGFFHLAVSGRGRMPLRTVGGKKFATFWPEVRLPDDTPTIAGPDRELDFIRSVEVKTLRELVEKAPKEPVERPKKYSPLIPGT